MVDFLLMDMHVSRADGVAPLKVWRIARGLSQTQLAKGAGISRITVGALERGENIPQLTTARSLADVLGCTVDDLVPPKK